MAQFRFAISLAALLAFPVVAYAQGNADPDAPAQSGVHKEAGKNIDAEATAGAGVEAGAADVDAEANVEAEGSVSEDAEPPVHQNESQ